MKYIVGKFSDPDPNQLYIFQPKLMAINAETFIFHNVFLEAEQVTFFDDEHQASQCLTEYTQHLLAHSSARGGSVIPSLVILPESDLVSIRRGLVLEVLSTQEAAVEAGKSQQQIIHLIKTQRLKAKRLGSDKGGSWAILRHDLWSHFYPDLLQDASFDAWCHQEKGEVIMNPLAEHNTIFITDIGSTTTKGLLLKKIGDVWTFAAEVDVPTTVERPIEDVQVGIINAAREIERSMQEHRNEAGIKILDESDNFLIPYLTTSSAGGGLQILVFGLTDVQTGRAAELAAYGAGGVILKTLTINDRIPPVSKMRLIRDLHPDLVLMAGGSDGGNIASIVRLAEILSLANPTPKFQQNEKIPLVFCGNVNARRFVSEVLTENFDIHIVENIKPTMEKWNTKPARKKVHELFMNNVMERAPGYSEVKKTVMADILPTPAGVEKMLVLYNEKRNQNLVMVDMGGATTDIFSNIFGEYSRTVAANTGMSYSISNIIADAQLEGIMEHLPDKKTCPLSEDNVRNYITNKTLNPTYVPQSDGEIAIEHAAAIAGIDLAWKKHLEMNFKVANIKLWDRLRQRRDIDPFQKLFYVKDRTEVFQAADVDLLIGAGGVLSHTRTPHDAFRILVDGFKPAGITKIAIDKSFKSPHLGVLSTVDPETALHLFEDECLQEIGHIIAPTGKVDSKKTVVIIKNNQTNKEHDLKGGDVLYFEQGGNLTIAVSKRNRLNQDVNELKVETDLPILIDCRGREEGYIGQPLAAYQIPAFSVEIDQFKTGVQQGRSEFFEGTYRFTRALPYEGNIYVKEGDQVDVDDLIGENIYSPPKIYIINVQDIVGYDVKLTKEKIKDGMLVSEGDVINTGQHIFESDTGLLGKALYSSPLHGKVVKIEENGMIICREVQDYTRKPVTIDIARELDMEPKKIKEVLKFKVGDFIERGQYLVNGALSGKPWYMKSPTTGTLKEIDTENGTIVIQYDIEPVALKAFVKGRVERVVENQSVDIVGKGTILYGIIGFGDENAGILEILNKNSLDQNHHGKIVVTFQPIDDSFLNAATDVGVAGIIAPSMNNSAWVEFYEKEIGVALTGDEDIPFTLILTEGFGEVMMNDVYRQFFDKVNGKTVSLSGRTQIRAGVTRPMMVV